MTEPTTGLPAFSTEPVEAAGRPPGVAWLVEIRSAHHDVDGVAFDRLILEFAGGLPGYAAHPEQEVFSPGSGDPVEIDGRAFVELVVFPAAMHDESGASTLHGPQHGGGHPTLVEYAVTADFEGYVHVATGLAAAGTGFRVIELTDPDRIVVDFAA
jgi:hypothetical protein